jgi:hypothetical protein
MIKEIEPHTDLIKYFEITHNFKSDLSVNVFTDNGEHYNVLSDIDQNIFLLKKLNEFDFLKEENHICDCGIGLGNALFEIYLQSLDINKNFYFYGVEKQDVYIKFIIDNLSHLWKDKLSLIKDDIMNVDYSKFNIVYSYSPFNNKKKLEKMYQKIVNEIQLGSIIVENANLGKGHFELLREFTELEEIDLDGLYIYKKI